jgi:hypothetical protein
LALLKDAIKELDDKVEEEGQILWQVLLNL